MVELIGATMTKTGLKVESALNASISPELRLSRCAPGSLRGRRALTLQAAKISAGSGHWEPEPAACQVLSSFILAGGQKLQSSRGEMLASSRIADAHQSVPL
jgi:hypothetical protein